MVGKWSTAAFLLAATLAVLGAAEKPADYAAMRSSELQKLLLAQGVHEDRVDACFETDRPKEALIALISERAGDATPPAEEFFSTARVDTAISHAFSSYSTGKDAAALAATLDAAHRQLLAAAKAGGLARADFENYMSRTLSQPLAGVIFPLMKGDLEEHGPEETSDKAAVRAIKALLVEIWERTSAELDPECKPQNEMLAGALRRWGDEVLPDYYEGYHILVKHNGLKSRRAFSSNRDPQGKQIKARTPAMATERLQALRTELEGLEGDVQERRISELARVESDDAPNAGSTTAAKYAADLASGAIERKSRIGFLGWFGSGQMAEEFERAAASVRVGQLAGPVETNHGMHLILRTG